MIFVAAHVYFAVVGLRRACWCPLDLQLARSWDYKVSGFVLIAVSMAPDHDRLLPTSHETRNVGTDDRLPEKLAKNLRNLHC